MAQLDGGRPSACGLGRRTGESDLSGARSLTSPLLTERVLQIRDRRAGRILNGAFPVALVRLEGGDDAARAVDEGAEAIATKGRRASAGAAALGAIAGDQEERVRQHFSQT